MPVACASLGIANSPNIPPRITDNMLVLLSVMPMTAPELEALESLVARLLAAVNASEATGTTVDVTQEKDENHDHDHEDL